MLSVIIPNSLAFPISFGLNPTPPALHASNPLQPQDIDLVSFDFASQKGWNGFYQQTAFESTTNKEQEEEEEQDFQSSFAFEWHASIDSQTILSMIPPRSRVVFVGTGNSPLPRMLHDRECSDNDDESGDHTSIVCIDYSQPCIDRMKNLHDESCAPALQFVCGDVRELNDLLSKQELNWKDGDSSSWDVIVDKGCMDALMCNEGWDWDLERYFSGCHSVLQPRNGKIILLSFKLTRTMKDYLLEIGERYGIDWDLDIPDKSNERVSFSIGSCGRS